MATQEEINAANAQILSDVEAGVESHEVDGQRTQLADPLNRARALQQLSNVSASNVAATKSHVGLRFAKLTPPGGGG